MLNASNVPEDVEKTPPAHSLFLSNNASYGQDLFILADRPWEILEIEQNVHLTINGYKLLSTLIKNPLLDATLIQKRQREIGRFSWIADNELMEIFQRNALIKRLFWVDLSGEMGIEEFIRYIRSCNFLLSNERNEIEAAWIGTTFHQVKEVGSVIPDQAASIWRIGGEFFRWLSEELLLASWKMQKFPIAKVLELLSKIERSEKLQHRFYRHRHEKRIERVQLGLYKKLQQVYGEFMGEIRKFNDIYQIVDALCIFSIWIRRGLVAPSRFSKQLESGTDIRDARHLLGGDVSGFLEHIPNDLNRTQCPIEVYCGANGGWKSTWLKTRLSLQLFHQAFGYVAWENVSLPVRKKIVFMNRGGSWYGESLSAFGNDIEKLKKFLPHVWDDTLIIMDEFGSTIPEHEAYALSRALIEFFQSSGAKTLFSTHNEELLRKMEDGSITGVGCFYVPIAVEGAWKARYSRKLQDWVDIAHTLEVFTAEWFPGEILSEARIVQSEGFILPAKQATHFIPYDIVSYSPKERNKLKRQRQKWFADFSRRNELLWIRERHKEGFVLKYAPLEEYQYPEESILLSNSREHWGYLCEKEETESGVEIILSWKKNGRLPKLHHLYGQNYRSKNFWESTLQGILKYGITNDPKELHERQQFFELLGEIGFTYFDTIFKRVNHFTWIENLLSRPYHWERFFQFDYRELTRFNLAIWEKLFRIVNDSTWLGMFGKGVVEDILSIIELERMLGNLPGNFDTELHSVIERLRWFVSLINHYQKSNDRTSKWQYPSTASIAERISQNIARTIELEYPNIVGELKNIVALLFEIIHATTKPVSIFGIDAQKRTLVGEFLSEKKLFSYGYSSSRRTREDAHGPENGIKGMIQVITAMRWSGNLMQPVYDTLRSLDSVHAHQMANYMEELIILPDVERFISAVKTIAEGAGKNTSGIYPTRKLRNNFRTNGFEADSSFAFFEFLGIAHTAEMIRKEGWTRVQYNETGDIAILGGYHPWKETLPKHAQVANDFFLRHDQSFDILEWATMGGKTMHIQSVSWILQLAHTIGYVPAKYANVPLLDGIIYIDRILEDEKRKLSAWQNDARYWKELIENIRARIISESVNGRYWWSIDEMFSSIPQRYQRGLVIAVLETLKSLWQRGQISIHNPEFVSKILSMDSAHYTVHHPQVIIKDGKLELTHKIVPGRSLDDAGHFSAFSIETAKSMWIPDFITEEAKKYR